ncbi:MAG: TPM domain-containing protein [Azonexus sp.]
MLLRILVLFWLLAAFLSSAAAHTVESLPNFRAINGSHVGVEQDIVSAPEANELNRILVDIEKRTNAQIALVAVSRIEPADIFSFAQKLFETWGIGRKGHDDGLLILLVKDLRTVRLHTGYGLEGVLPDALCKRIEHDLMVPHFREGNYGQGLLAGVREIDRVLSDPAYAAEQVATLPLRHGDSWYAFLSIVGGSGALVVLIVFALKSMFGYFSDTEVRQGDTPISMRYSRRAWLFAFLGGPALIFAIVHVVPLASPILSCLLALYLYFMLVAVGQVWRERRLVRDLWAQKKHLPLYRLLEQEQDFWGKIAALFPLPFLLFWIYHGSRQKHYRNAPRACGKCAQPMRKLAESEEDAYLSPAQQKEEEVQSIDHDVWLCEACQMTERWAYPGKTTIYSPCPKCKNQTLMLESDTVIQVPKISQGQGERVYSCSFCAHKKSEKYLIYKRGGAGGAGGAAGAAGAAGAMSGSSSDSDSSSSSSSGSSWGGGDSGGGGASSSW